LTIRRLPVTDAVKVTGTGQSNTSRPKPSWFQARNGTDSAFAGAAPARARAAASATPKLAGARMITAFPRSA
jgi:hypothetical protein